MNALQILTKRLTRMFVLTFDGGRNGDSETKPLLKIVQWMAVWR